MGVIRVIICKSKVYTTTHNTIVFKGEIMRTRYNAYSEWHLTDYSRDVIDKAKSVAWNYATYMNFNQNLKTLDIPTEEWTSKDVFDYLERVENKTDY